MDDEDRKTLAEAVEIVNQYGRHAAEYLAERLREPDHEEAAEWMEVHL